jgi:hypothetical protein
LKTGRFARMPWASSAKMAEGSGWIYMGLRERSGLGALKEAALSVD